MRKRRILFAALAVLPLLALPRCGGAGYWPLTTAGIDAMHAHPARVESLFLDGEVQNAVVEYDDGSRYVIRQGIPDGAPYPDPSRPPVVTIRVDGDVPAEWTGGEPLAVLPRGVPSAPEADVVAWDLGEVILIRRFGDHYPPGVASAPRLYEDSYVLMPAGRIVWGRARTWGMAATMPFRAAIDAVAFPFRAVLTIFTLRGMRS